MLWPPGLRQKHMLHQKICTFMYFNYFSELSQVSALACLYFILLRTKKKYSNFIHVNFKLLIKFALNQACLWHLWATLEEEELS